MPPIRDAVILAGGLGSRLLPLTRRTPKPLLALGGRPLLECLFARLAQAGLRRVVLAARHQASAIERSLPGLRRFGLRVELRREARPLGTAGALRRAWPDPRRACLALNGDVLSDFDLGLLLRDHAAAGAEATLLAVQVGDPAAYGVLETDRRGRLLRFVEKPRPGQSASRRINAGAYALEPGLLELIPPGRACSLEREVFPALLQAGRPLRVHLARGCYWRDIGTPAAYLQANRDLLRGRLWGGRGLARRLWGRPDAQGNLWGPAVLREPGCRVRGSVIGRGCRLGSGARVDFSVLGEACSLGPGARLSGALLAEGARVGAGGQMRPGSALGPGRRLAAGETSL